MILAVFLALSSREKGLKTLRGASAIVTNRGSHEFHALCTDLYLSSMGLPSTHKTTNSQLA